MATQPNHIENPFEYAAEKLAWGVRDFSRFLIPHPERHAGQAAPVVQKIGIADLREALSKGVDDMGALRDDVLFIGLIYPIAGVVLAAAAFNANLLMMLFPLASGFAILGPMAATGLYEMSRRREQGEDVSWMDAMRVFGSSAIGSILGVGVVLMAIFGVWMAVAYQIGVTTLGAETPPTLRVFLENVFRSDASPVLIVGGVAVGFVFAAFAFAISVVSVPLLLDRDVGLFTAIKTSLKAVQTNFGTMVVWAAIIAGALVLGSIPALVGLIVVVPILGHASWHLYRKMVA